MTYGDNCHLGWDKDQQDSHTWSHSYGWNKTGPDRNIGWLLLTYYIHSHLRTNMGEDRAHGSFHKVGTWFVTASPLHLWTCSIYYGAHSHDLWQRPRYICEPAAFIIPYLMGQLHCSSNENEINVFLERGDTHLPIQKSKWRIIDDAKIKSYFNLVEWPPFYFNL